MPKKVKPYVKVYKLFKKIYDRLKYESSALPVYIKLKVNDVTYGKGLKSGGVPHINVYDYGNFSIGDNFTMNNGNYNLIGRQQPCYFIVLDHASLKIGNNVGMSCTAIVCHNSITIADNVKIGGNVIIYDTDFHSLDKNTRQNHFEDMKAMKTAPVIIENDVFIGAHSIILKGVVIGEGAIIGAGSLVSKSIPANEIWAGNPAKFIRSVVRSN